MTTFHAKRPASSVQLPASLRRKTIGIIGAGNMGQALMRGLLDAGCAPAQLLAVEANPSTRAVVRRRYRVCVSTLKEVAARCDVLLIAVKPQDVQPVVATLSIALKSRRSPPLVLTIAAGLTIRAFERRLGRCPVIRVMPNLPATVGRAVSAMAAGRFAASAHRRMAHAIFRCVGEVVELPERLFDTVTAVSGSGPAYFFLIFQALRDAAMRGGIPKPVAERLVTRTALGSVELVNASTDGLDVLIRRVASKGGTTEAALRVFAQAHLAAIIQDGVMAAARRARQLTAALGSGRSV